MTELKAPNGLLIVGVLQVAHAVGYVKGFEKHYDKWVPITLNKHMVYEDTFQDEVVDNKRVLIDASGQEWLEDECYSDTVPKLDLAEGIVF